MLLLPYVLEDQDFYLTSQNQITNYTSSSPKSVAANAICSIAIPASISP